MKKFIFSLAITSIIFSCQNSKTEETSYEAELKFNSYGAEITDDNAAGIFDLQTLLGNEEILNVKLTGEIESTCAVKGCWMTLKTGENSTIRVTFKDYGFFVPKEGAEGKNAIVDGVLTRTTTSVEDLRHYAMDAGKTTEEINAITEPIEEFAFEATGVLIQEL